jgi:hypothetical protein
MQNVESMHLCYELTAISTGGGANRGTMSGRVSWVVGKGFHVVTVCVQGGYTIWSIVATAVFLVLVLLLCIWYCCCVYHGLPFDFTA